MQPIQMRCFRNRNTFSNFFFFLHFWNVHKILNTLKKIWTSDVICFSNYRLQKSALLKCLKNLMSEHLWTVNMLKGPKHCSKLHGSILLVFFKSLWKKICLKSSVFIVSEILRQFVKIVTPDDKYSLSVKGIV